MHSNLTWYDDIPVITNDFVLILTHCFCNYLRGGPLDNLGGGGRKISPARIFLFSWKLRPNFFFIV